MVYVDEAPWEQQNRENAAYTAGYNAGYKGAQQNQQPQGQNAQGEPNAQHGQNANQRAFDQVREHSKFDRDARAQKEGLTEIIVPVMLAIMFFVIVR